ncbi:putative G-type lectin S-receptor-like serine/threonine-protein kinase [Acorus calamus]|uniref:G-type lectin S-receptor-like serine/threonine-protein kinase n=1 Tax=Acorus calamus TaxID=4465 RepID=A0AAV9C7L1_ACOCL|nr:putative G-type lectin S-receptor-like serine/threonine-protein kinase [Acorus calamus]
MEAVKHLDPVVSRRVPRPKISPIADPTRTSNYSTTIIILSFLQLLHGIAAADRITPDSPIAVNETIISSGKSFALGFFNSLGNLYVGIWYNNIPGPRTVVWVANRDRPLKDPTGVFTVTQSGNLAILDAKGITYWSSNTSNGTEAVLLDTGNLILLGNGSESSLFWQSFDDPSDTLLPGMRLGSSKLVSWRNDSDPSPGEFSFGVDPGTLFQMVTWKGSDPYWRRHLWKGSSLSVTSDTNGSMDSDLRLVQNDMEANITFISNALGRYLLDSMGKLKMMYWEDSIKNWTVNWVRPERPCDLYDRCGPNGICDDSFLAQTCSCLQGFEPQSQKDWQVGDWSRGCVRTKPLSCDKGDVFFKLQMIKLPDQLRQTRSASSAMCEAECVNSCDCMAYTFLNATLAGSLSSCMVWGRDLTDLEQLTTNGENLYNSTRSGLLDWEKRYHIIEGIAQGLLYLHQYSRLRIIHRDLKTSNILLDDSMNPKISDFGLARIFGGTQKEANTERVVGTCGYMSPEYALGGFFSEKSDVFSFGVVVLEIITGKRSTGFYLEDQSLNLLGYARKHWGEGRSLDLLDPCWDFICFPRSVKMHSNWALVHSR